MKKLLNIHLKSDGKVHAHNPMEHNFTICMKALTEQHEKYEETADKITCKECIKFISYCKQFKASELKSTKIKSEPLQITKDDLRIWGGFSNSIGCEKIKDGMLNTNQLYAIQNRIDEEVISVYVIDTNDLGYLIIQATHCSKDDSILEPIASIINEALKNQKERK